MAGPGDRFTAHGEFAVDGVGLEGIVGRFGTPVYVYSAGTIRAQYRRLAGAFPGFTVCYSLKANPNPSVCRLLREEGAGAEVSSGAELATALGAGFNPGNVVFVGPAKTDAEIEAAVGAGIGAVVADCPEDLRRVDAAAVRLDRDASVLCRVNTREQPAARESMVGGPSKFGFDEETAAAAIRATPLRRARVRGIQVYSASQVLDGGFVVEHVRYVLDLSRRLSADAGLEVRMLDFGGGFGIPYGEHEPELDLDRAATGVARLRAGADWPGGCRLLFESGRFLVGPAGVFLTRVERVKESRGRTFVITDGGMNAFSRPVVMGVAHRVRLLNKPGSAPTGRFDVCGPICTPIDVLGRDVALPTPEPGDIIGLLDAGAYGYSMSLLGFMSRVPPVEVLADEGRLTPAR